MAKFDVGDKVKYSKIVLTHDTDKQVGEIGGYYDDWFPIVIYDKLDDRGNKAAVLHESCLEKL
jgi:hypothetical protein